MADLERQRRIARDFVLNISKGGARPEDYSPELTAWSGLSGSMRGDEYLPKLEMVEAIFNRSLEITIDSETAQVGRVVLQAHGRGRLFNGSDYTNDYIFLVEFDEEDRIRHVREYFDMTRVQQILVPAIQLWHARQEA